LLDWINSWTDEEKVSYAKLADDMEEASKEFHNKLKLRDNAVED
jgi:hypothetical protein